jgi:hypothetical protein
MFARRRGAPWLPALIAGGLGAALISRRARWHAGHQPFAGPGFTGPGFAGRGPGRGLPPKIEEMLNAWHKQAHGEAPAAGGQTGPSGPQTPPGDA